MKKIILLLFVACFAYADSDSIHHNIQTTVVPTTSFIEVVDEITIGENILAESLEFSLHHALVLANNKNIKLVEKNITGKDVGMDIDDSDSQNLLRLNKYKITVPKKHSGDFKVIIKYTGKIESPVKQSAENYARGFSESSGIIWEKGVYLAGSTYWVPYFNDKLLTFKLTTTLPNNWSSVTTGKRVLNQDNENTHVDTWDSTTPQEEVFFIAAAFTEYTYSMGSVDAMAFLRTPDEGLANKYLETTAQYMEMYRKLLGPYPYTKFALVENFWETGYGMPSFTLLGEKIIRFPFILHSSYPHELLHNWWGNSVYVDFETGNWCEGLTAYMADHLIKEQRNQGEVYRRSTLQKYTNFVNPKNDFPLNKFLSRHDAASEAIGYGKTLMVNHMLRQKVGDANFVRAYQIFNRNNKFKRASFSDIRESFETTTSEDLKWYFEQWVDRTGAPSLVLKDVKVKSVRGKDNLSFVLQQTQKDKVFYLDVPVAILTDKGLVYKTVSMDEKKQTFTLPIQGKPLKVLVDPHFDLFRILDPRESPPTFTKAYGANKTLIVLPDSKHKKHAQYKQLAKLWIAGKEDSFVIKTPEEVSSLPSNKAVMLLGLDNKFSSLFNKELEQYDSKITIANVNYGKRKINTQDNSFFISIANPENVKQIITLLSIGNSDAVAGLARKLPHYGKYSYLAFSGDEPSNIAKGKWGVSNSPLNFAFDKSAKVELEKRTPLATLSPVFSAQRMMETVSFLADDILKGRGLGSKELDESATYIANKFKEYGLKPSDGLENYLQQWQQTVLDKKNISLSNVVGIIPGTNKDLKEVVVLSAHYDHLGLGWPDGKKGNNGKIHNGADDNASGIAVLLEMAKTLGKTAKPARTIMFVAFTGEEAGLVGSKHFVKDYLKTPDAKIFANLNIDTVGRLFDNKLMVLNSNTAHEWKFIFMGTDYTTGVASQLITQELDASDQMSFIKAGIPAVQLFYAGVGSDYHVPEDTADKIDAAGLVKVASVVREIIEYLAERTEPMPFTGKQATTSKVKTKPTSGKRAATGSMPDFAFSGKGVRIAGVSKDSAADVAGLKEGDIIINFDSVEISSLKDYSDLLKKHKPNDKVLISVLRGKETIETTITLGER